MGKSTILLESGTNEVELLEFYLGTQSFGINVLKIKHILRYDPDDLIVPPQSDPAVLGAIDIHNKVVPVIDLKTFYDFSAMAEYNSAVSVAVSDVPNVVIMTEFNNANFGFVVDGVNRIHRISWNNLQSINDSFPMDYIVGEVIIGERVILILDLEKVVGVLFKNPNFDALETPADIAPALVTERKHLHIVCADDSSLIRRVLENMLKAQNYGTFEIYNNGKSAYERVLSLKASGVEVDLVITDIEMPQMDGLTLCKNLKNDIPGMPVVVLSSLISEQMLRRCESVGADMAISKKELEKLIPIIDQLCIKTTN